MAADDLESSSISDQLLAVIDSFGNAPAISFKNQIYSYFDLKQATNQRIDDLVQFGVTPGSRVVVIGDFSFRTVATMLAIVKIRATFIPLTNESAKKVNEIVDLVSADFIIEIDKDLMKTGNSRFVSSELNPLLIDLYLRNCPGLILLTSGSTGIPKAVVHDFSKLLSKFLAPKPPLKTINFLLFDHWGGLNTLLQVLSSGGFVVFPESRSPDEICRLIEEFKLTLLPTSPSFLNMLLLTGAISRYDLSSLATITYGAEPMPAYTLANLHKNLPNVKLKQTYGLIELGVMSSKSKSDDSLLIRIGGDGFEYRVVDDLLEIKSESSMLGYLNAPSPFTPDGYFKTGDQVEVHGEYLRILGRASDLINVGGEKVYPAEIEEVILEIYGVRDVLVYGESNPFSGKIVCANIVIDENVLDSSSVRRLVRQHCSNLLPKYKVPIKISVVPEILVSNRFKKVRNLNTLTEQDPDE
jgi:long-chain acyl-CoA synthetase